MQFQLGSVVNLVQDADKVLSLFLTYNGSTHSIAFNHECFSTPEKTKETLVGAVSALVDAYIASKS